MRWLLLLLLLAGVAGADPDIIITTRDQAVFAILKPDGTVIRAGLPAGSIDASGRVVVDETYVGDIKPDGHLYTAGGKDVARVDDAGTIFFRDQAFIKIFPKGPISRVLDSKHTVPWGKFTPGKYGFTRLRQVAAVA